MSYTNADGLRVLTNADQGTAQDTGTDEGIQSFVLDIDDFTALGTTVTIDPNDAVIPAGSIILGATLVMTSAATSGGSATLSIGTYAANGDAIDADGIDQTIALTAIDADNDVVRCDGAQTAATGYLTADAHVAAIYGTAAFTAGTGKVVIEYKKIA
jgi:hypothetical protein